MALVEKFGPLLGRIMIAYLFIPSGIRKLNNFDGTLAYINAKSLPMPEVAAAIAIVVEILVAAALLVGFKTRYAALVLALFTLAAAIGFHNYWAVPEAQKMAQMISFNKNIGIAGGLLAFAAFGAGAFSLDNRRR
jgi:putative oxidoreductase